MKAGSFGVDVSTHNGALDFDLLKKRGVGFIIARCGYGSDYVNQDDDQFERNIQGAIKAKMPWGVYLYSYATNLDMAQSEVFHVKRLLNGRIAPLGVWFDIEDPSQVDLPNATKVAMCEKFCDEMEKLGQFSGVYSSLSWFEGPLNSPKLDRFAKWVAQWNSSFDYGKPATIWQFTDNFTINGRSFDGNKLLTDMEWPKKSKPWYQDAVDYVQKAGLMVGDGKGFRPNDKITRAEVAQILYNISKK